jgi:hypothetical protein
MQPSRFYHYCYASHRKLFVIGCTGSNVVISDFPWSNFHVSVSTCFAFLPAQKILFFCGKLTVATVSSIPWDFKFAAKKSSYFLAPNDSPECEVLIANEVPQQVQEFPLRLVIEKSL